MLNRFDEVRSEMEGGPSWKPYFMEQELVCCRGMRKILEFERDATEILDLKENHP